MLGGASCGSAKSPVESQERGQSREGVWVLIVHGPLDWEADSTAWRLPSLASLAVQALSFRCVKASLGLTSVGFLFLSCGHTARSLCPCFAKEHGVHPARDAPRGPTKPQPAPEAVPGSEFH